MKRILALILALSLLCMPALGNETGGMLEKAEAFVAAGDLESAYICLDIAQKLSPNDPAVLRDFSRLSSTVLSGFARLSSAEANYTRALKLIEEALALTPTDGSLYLEKARLLYITDNLSEAEQVLRCAEICSAQPDDDLTFEAARAYLRAGQHEHAVELFKTLPDAFWKNGYAVAYAHALIRSGNLELAQTLGLAVPGKDEVLSVAIQDGKSIRLVPAHETLMRSLNNLPLFSSAAFAEEKGVSFEPADDHARVRLLCTIEDLGISSDNIRLYSVSPSGNAFLFDLSGTAAIVRDQEIMLLAVNRDRGAQNEYTVQTYSLIENRPALPTEPDVFCWSPDERYITMTFLRRTLITGHFMDLLLADTRSGDIFLTEATPKKMRIEGTSTATTACFDENGEYVYYLVYGNLAGVRRSGLKRYCLETGETELLCTVDDAFFYYSQLSVDKSGVVRSITDDTQEDRHLGVITFTNVDGEWKSEIRSFPNPKALQTPCRYYRSENSGYELFLSKGRSSEGNANEDTYYLTLYNETLGTGSDAYAIRLPVDGSGQAEPMEIGEYLSAVAQKTIEQPYILQVTPSPDGYSALILATYDLSVVCCILDLDTLICSRVEFPAQPDLISTIQSFTTLSWLEDGTIMIPSSGTGNLFKLFIE
ncbi:MAG: hypothetical protein SOW46_10475 [Candidatus Aphodomonas sp.]|nr:hypothetical protein [Candidatus Aphodomonas sp.]